MNWLLLLFLAGLLETAWATGLKYTHGFSRPWPTLAVLALMAGSVGAVILGIVLFGEPLTVPRLACVGLIVAGIAGLKLVS